MRNDIEVGIIFFNFKEVLDNVSFVREKYVNKKEKKFIKESDIFVK